MTQQIPTVTTAGLLGSFRKFMGLSSLSQKPICVFANRSESGGMLYAHSCKAFAAYVFNWLLNLINVNFAGRGPVRRYRYKQATELRNQKARLSAGARRNVA